MLHAHRPVHPPPSTSTIPASRLPGTPSDATLALALVLCARRAAELSRFATPAQLVAAARAAEGEEGGPEVRGAARRARCALGAVAAQALAQVRGALDAAGAGEGAAGFDAAAREYAETRRDILERAVASLGVF